ncbi:MAG: GAF domain-containing sensor histidine kinase, partial [Anaerolineales bacterium]
QNSFGYDEKLDLQASFEECLYLTTLRSGTTIIIEDIQQHPSLVHQNCFQKPLQGSRSTIFIPLCYSHQLIGLVMLTYSQIIQFDNPLLSNFRLFQEMVDSAMVRLEIMENLERMVLDRTRDLRALYDITTLLNTPIRFEEGILEVLKRTLSLTSARATSIHSYDGNNQKIGLLQQVGFSALMANQLQNFSPFLEILQEVILQGSVVYFDNIAEKISQLQNTAIHQRLSYLGIPIKARGKPLGILSVVGLSKPFSMNDQILLIAIADHLGLFIERNRLALQAEEAAKLEERQRLARELHDALTQSLYSMTLLSKAYQRALPYSDKEEILRWLKEFNTISQDAMKELRLLLYELRPTALEQDGLGGALKRRLETVEKRAGIDTHLEINGYFRLSAEEEEIIYRIIQEALNNALQHAHHHRLEILFQSSDKELSIQIKDDGVGFDPQSIAQNTNGMGLMNMKTRASQIGAELKIISAPAQGTTILLKKELQHE